MQGFSLYVGKKRPWRTASPRSDFLLGRDNHFYPKRDKDDCPGTHLSWGKDVYPVWGKVVYPLAGQDLTGLDDICTYEISVLFTWNACICKVFRYVWIQKDPGELLLQGLIFCWGRG